MSVFPVCNGQDWVELTSLGNAWYAAFTFWLIGSLVFAGMIGMAMQVGSGAFD
jgi:hypothetical protein